MHARCVRWGNSLALRISSAHAKDLALTEGTPVEISVEGGRLVATPRPEPVAYRLDELLAGIDDDNLHGEVGTGGVAVGGEFA